MLPVAAFFVVLALAGGVLLGRRLADDDPPRRLHSDDTEDQATASSTPSVCKSAFLRPSPDEPRDFPDFYTQRTEAMGIDIVAGPGVSSAAIARAQETLRRMFKDNHLADTLKDQGAYIIIADESQGVLDLPEFACLADEPGSQRYTHVCGVADRADYPVATVNELDLLGNRKGPCKGLNILYHEVGHLVQGWTLEHADYIDLRVMYQEAINSGKYKGLYAERNPNEYFADGTQAYFLTADPERKLDRNWLKQNDPALYEFLSRLYGDPD